MWHHNGIIQTPVAYQRVPKDPDKHFRGDRTGGGFRKLGRLVFFRPGYPGGRYPQTLPKYGGDIEKAFKLGGLTPLCTIRFLILKKTLSSMD